MQQHLTNLFLNAPIGPSVREEPLLVVVHLIALSVTPCVLEIVLCPGLVDHDKERQVKADEWEKNHAKRPVNKVAALVVVRTCIAIDIVVGVWKAFLIDRFGGILKSEVPFDQAQNPAHINPKLFG